MRRRLTEAVKRANAKDTIVTMDADNTHPVGLALSMVRSIREGNDIVIASRYRKGSQVRGVSFYRRALSTAASWLCRILFPIRGVRDYTCSYRAYRADVIKALVDRYGSEFISERSFSCMLDILLRLRECNPVASEVPQVLQPFFFIHLSVKWGEYLWPFTAELTPIWKQAIKRSKLP